MAPYMEHGRFVSKLITEKLAAAEIWQHLSRRLVWKGMVLRIKWERSSPCTADPRRKMSIQKRVLPAVRQPACAEFGHWHASGKQHFPGAAL